MPTETVKIVGLEGVLDVLRKLPAEVVSKAGGPIKFGVKAAAEVLRDEAKRNVRKIVTDPNRDGLPSDSTGKLEANIVAARSKMPPGVNGERFLVRVRRKPYEVSPGAKPVTTPQVGRLLEYGHERMEDPKPWLRPAFDTKKAEALRVFVSEVKKRTDAAIKRLERQARTKR